MKKLQTFKKGETHQKGRKEIKTIPFGESRFKDKSSSTCPRPKFPVKQRGNST